MTSAGEPGPVRDRAGSATRDAGPGVSLEDGRKRTSSEAGLTGLVGDDNGGESAVPVGDPGQAKKRRYMSQCLFENTVISV